jgi:NTP pyrophosphatase (non-canonical NTP hydrolase)
MGDFGDLTIELREFAKARDWEKFHVPKNLVIALAGEVGELLSEFQWLTNDEALIENLSDLSYKNIKMEMADVAIYLIRLADVLKIDLKKVVEEKIQINEERFPA